MKRQRRELSPTRLLWGCATIVTCTLASLSMVAPAGAITDDFNTSHDYTLGDGTGTIWTGVHNIPLLTGGQTFDANTTNAGVLTVSDNGTFDQDNDPGTNPPGMGWEGGRSTAPFLHTPVPAGQDFTATVKIVGQTSGTWSAAGLLARAPSATPPGFGADNADENFVTMTSFRTDMANVNEGNTLMKRIQNGAQMQDNNFPINNTTEPLPLVLKLERVGGGVNYRGWVSTDNGATFQFQSRVTPPADSPLRDPTMGLEVGLHYQLFGGTFDHDMDTMTPQIPISGTAQFDDFELTTYDPLPAPGAPTISTAQLAYTVPKGGTVVSSLFEATGTDPLAWIRTPNLAGTDAMLPGANGGAPSPLVPVPPDNGSYFRWAVPAAQANGVYPVVITATNDWGQVSNSITIAITVIPEPSTIALAGLLIVGIAGSIRRRRL